MAVWLPKKYLVPNFCKVAMYPRPSNKAEIGKESLELTAQPGVLKDKTALALFEHEVGQYTDA